MFTSVKSLLNLCSTVFLICSQHLSLQPFPWIFNFCCVKCLEEAVAIVDFLQRIRIQSTSYNALHPSKDSEVYNMSGQMYGIPMSRSEWGEIINIKQRDTNQSWKPVQGSYFAVLRGFAIDAMVPPPSASAASSASC